MMIEASINVVDGVRFIDNIRIVEPIEKRLGVPVELIDDNFLREASGEVEKALRFLGLKEVDFQFQDLIHVFAHYPENYIRFKITHSLLRCYWKTVSWLYDNARFFKQIPEYESFSWSYFTPCVWYKNLRARFIRKVS